ncbi:MAG: ABC transporter ATP-binding protein [Anaerolineae bacterium]|nr:MAG: ABC transporter ATP-binding protein [Anaerolineae bacterium]
MNPALQVTSLTKRFGDFTAVDHISFEVQRGEIFGFLGPNGAGKTTTIRMILGLLAPDEGEIEVLGQDVRKDPAGIRPRVGYMSQRFSLYNDLTVLQNLRFYGRAYGLSNRRLEERIAAALELADLKGREHIKTGELSGGWRQRLALGAAILHQPEVIFLDEPTAGVDPVSRRAFWDLLYRLIQQGVTIFVTTHYMDEAEHCHRLAFIQRGRIIALGSPSEIKAQKMSGQILEIACQNPSQAMQVLLNAQKQQLLPVTDIELYGAMIHIVTPQPKAAGERIAALLSENHIALESIQTIEPTLEDVFIAAMSA